MAAIDIGGSALNRDNQLTTYKTYFSEYNPADGDGIIDTINLWFRSGLGTPTGVKVGTYYGSGTSYTLRDSVNIGTLTEGSKQTITGLNLQVRTGDFIGVFYTGGALTRDTFSDWWEYQAPDIATGTQTFTHFSYIVGDNLSVGGSGVTVSVGSSNFFQMF